MRSLKYHNITSISTDDIFSAECSAASGSGIRPDAAGGFVGLLSQRLPAGPTSPMALPEPKSRLVMPTRRRNRTKTQGNIQIYLEDRILSSVFFQSNTPMLLPPANRAGRARAPRGTEGRSRAGSLACPDFAAFLWQAQAGIQGPSSPALCPIPCCFPHSPLPFRGRRS